MSAQSSSAQNRTLQVWLQKVEQGEIKLPRFQRYEAWDYKRICSLLDAVIKNLPLGATLIHMVGSKEQFISRYISTAPQNSPNGVNEHLLDGQQRITSLYRALNNNYEYETYFVYLPEFDKTDDHFESEEKTVFCVGRYYKKNNQEKYPLWANSPRRCFERGLIPMELFKPFPIESEVQNWVKQATDHLKGDGDALIEYYETQNKLTNEINKIREIIKYYNLPHLTLPHETPKDVALRVFINMNTNTKPLTVYDVVVAEVESAAGVSLHDMEVELDNEIPDLKKIDKLDYLILATSALLQNKRPYARGMLDMDFHLVVENWPKVKKGLSEFLDFISSMNIIHRKLLPSTINISAIASILSNDFSSSDEKGKAIILLRKYMWSCYLTDRYESSPITKLMQDYKVLQSIINNELKDNGETYTEKDVPVLNRQHHPLITADEFISAKWPTRENMKARSLISMSSMLGAFDWSTGQQLSTLNIQDREYHHVFPKGFLEDADVNPDVAMNAAFITSTTNRNLGKESPFDYIKEKYSIHNESHMNNRLHSHLMSPHVLKEGSFDENDKLKKKAMFEKFLADRAEIATKAAEILCNGEVLTIESLFQSHTGVQIEYLEIDKDITQIEAALRERIVSIIEGNIVDVTYEEVLNPKIAERAIQKLKARAKKDPSINAELITFRKLIDYLSLGEYQEIITSKKYWSFFESLFLNQHNLKMRFTQLSTCRNIIRHGNTLTPVEKSDGEAAVYWFKQILSL